MRHSYIDTPRRIRAPRATPRSRARFLPAVVALPAVAVLWLTVGLPMLSQLTSAAGSNPLGRTVVFAAQATGPGAGADGGLPAPQTVAAATVSNQVLAGYQAEVARRAQARAHVVTKRNAKVPPNLALPQPALRGATPDSATLTTADAPQARSRQPVDPPPAQDTSPGSGNSGGAGTSDPGGGSGDATTPPPDPGDGDSGDTDNTGDSNTGDTGDAGSVGGGATSPPPPPPPPPPGPPPPPPPPPPSGLTPADIQTTSGGGPRGKPAAGDAIVYTFASAPDPSLILPGWSGSTTTVTLRVNENGANDFVTILNAATGGQLPALGSVQLGGNYADKGDITAIGSKMTLNGSVVTVVLGTPNKNSRDQQSVGTMVWMTSGGTATESGPADNEF
jgi:hypothetical protein